MMKARTFIGWLLAAAITVMSPAALAKKTPEFYEMDWSEFMPPLDDKILAQFDAGNLSQQEIDDYLDWLGKEKVPSLDGKKVKVPGFLVPLNLDKNSMATELLLVPTAGSCIHVPPPPPNQTIYLKVPKGIHTTDAGYVPFYIEGTLRVKTSKSKYTDSLYELEVSNYYEYE